VEKLRLETVKTFFCKKNAFIVLKINEKKRKILLKNHQKIVFFNSKTHFQTPFRVQKCFNFKLFEETTSCALQQENEYKRTI
jgi:hypothetical protein